MIHHMITLLLLATSCFHFDAHCAMKQSVRSLIPSFYDFKKSPYVIPRDSQGLQCYCEPKLIDDQNIYDHQFITSLNQNIQTLRTKNIDTEIINCYKTRIIAELFHIKYTRMALLHIQNSQGPLFILPTRHNLLTKNDFFKNYLPDKNGFFSYPNLRNTHLYISIPCEEYQKTMTHLLEINIENAKKKSFSPSIIDSYKRMIAWEIICTSYDLLTYANNTPPKNLF